MKTTTRFDFFASSIAAALLAACAQAPAEDNASPFEMSAEDQAAMGAEAMSMGMPGAEHEALMERTGEWTVAVRMAGMDGWMDATGGARMEAQFGGRYLTEFFNMDMGGMPFNGQYTLTYDNYHKEFVGTWFDDMSTSPLMFRGNVAKDGWLELSAEITDAYSPDGRIFKHRTRMNDDGTMTVQMFDQYKGAEEMMSMEFTYSRAN